MAENYTRITEGLGFELSVYEVNHHITGGDASEEVRNRIVTGLGGGLNVANWMALMLERQNVRYQNLFGFIQLRYRNHLRQSIRLWGTCLNMEKGQERYRPTFQAVELMNKVLHGDLVDVTLSGDHPTWTCEANYERKGNESFDVPYLYAYATKDGKHRGLILFNLHRTEDLPVQVNLSNQVKPETLTKWVLSAETIDANNEPEHDAEVFITEEKAPQVTQEISENLKPFSLTVFAWEDQ